MAPNEYGINVWISVRSDRKICVWPNAIRVPHGYKVTIRWKILNSGGWTFNLALGGVVIPAASKGRVFTGRVPGDTEFTWVDDNTAPASANVPGDHGVDVFLYDIHLIRGEQKLHLDPAIENENC